MTKKFIRGIIITFPLLLALVVARIYVNKPTNFFNRAFGTEADIRVNTQSITPQSIPVWANFAQGGEEKERMLNPVINEVSKLKPDYIRIDHVFDFYDVVTRNSEGSLSFDWTKLDLTIDDILSSGAKPFISASYMPEALTSGNNLDLPVNWTDWEISLTNLIEHLSRDRKIEGVYYEIWNEPDLFGQFKTSGEKNYLELYRHSIIGANNAQGTLPFKIGGPATTGMLADYIGDLIDSCLGNNLRLDFVSWHRYSKNIDIYENDIGEIKKLISGYPGFNPELIITEAGFDGENNQAYDRVLSAIHTLASAAVLEGRVDKLFSFEIKDGPGEEKFWGRWGILTHEKYGEPTQKPRYHAFEFLNYMEGENVELSGMGSWVKAFAKKNGNTIRVMLVNYDPKGNHFEPVPITFQGLTPGDYKLTRKNFLGQDIEKTLVVESDNLRIVEELDANGAAIIEITPI